MALTITLAAAPPEGIAADVDATNQPAADQPPIDQRATRQQAGRDASAGVDVAKKSKVDFRAFEQKLSKDEQPVHAVERLTFGPRAGDLEAVRAMGVKKWIDLQLHPERIPENPELAQRLAPLESLRLSQMEVARNYPTPQLIRAIAAGRAKMPEDPVTRAAVERLLERFRAKKSAADADKLAVNGAPNGTNPAANNIKNDIANNTASNLANNTANTLANNLANTLANSGANNNDENRPLEIPERMQDLFTQAEIRTLRTGSFEEKRRILAGVPKAQEDDVAIAIPAGLRGQLLAAAQPELRRKMMLMNAPQQMVAFDLAEGKLYRAILSNRQLEEQLVDFWYNHFNVFLDKGADRFLVPSYEREAIRPHVLGRFRDLLEATATSPAMLFYLDNWESVGPANNGGPARRPQAKRPVRGLNENYARELMELHTLGVDGGYTQKDVTEVARCFTGWTIRAPKDGGGFFFNAKVHDKGEKTVLGVKIPAGGGREDGEKVLDILAKRPATARFISTKLAERFVADNPPPKLIDKMAKTFLQSNGDIRAVLKTMLTSDEFFSRGAYLAKVKSPLEMVVSAIRVTGADVDYAFPLANRLNQLGEPLYRKLEPTGYSNTGDEWVNSASLLGRMNFALDLVQGKVQGIRVDAVKFGSEDVKTIARVMLLKEASPETRAAVEKAIANQSQKTTAAASSASAGAMMAGLLLGSPEFQRR